MQIILVINAGSTSVKWRLVEQDTELVVGSYVFESEKINFTFTSHSETSTGSLFERTQVGWHLVGVVAGLTESEAVTVLHRIVHGGTEFREVTELTPDVLTKLRTFEALAPLHQPVALDFVDLIREAQPKWGNYGVFDTAFHATLEPQDYLYALPREVSEEHGLRRYGFHGISHGFVARRMRELAPKARRIVSVHLGGGASVCGILDGKSKYISMGLTPEEGLIMATRSGTIPAGVVCKLLREGYSIDELESMLNRESGLRGLAGTGDMRQLLDREDTEAVLALEIYTCRVAQEIAAAVIRLSEVDAVVFTGQIGWHSVEIRGRILKRLRAFGVRAGGGTVVEEGVWRQRYSPVVGVWALEAQEEAEMLRLFNRQHG